MSEENIFTEQQTPPAGEQQPTTTQLPDHLKELVGPGKKYATVEKALESIPHAQQHISTLETELKGMREKIATAVSAEQVYETVQQLLEAEKATLSTAAVDENSLAALLDRKLTEREQAAKQQSNVQSVKAALANKFGEKAEEMYVAKATELGVGIQFLNDIVKHSPKAALELFGLAHTPTPPRSTTGGINTEALNAQKQPKDKPQTVMGGASTNEMLDAWRAAKPQ